MCSDGECLQAVCTALLIYPPSPSKISSCVITPDKLVCDLRQSHQPEPKAGRSPKCIVWGQLGFFPDKPVPLAAVQCTLLLNCNHNPLCSRRCYSPQEALAISQSAETSLFSPNLQRELRQDRANFNLFHASVANN